MELDKFYLSGLASLPLAFRGWGGVASILRKTSSGLGFVVSSLRGFFSVIGKSSQNQEKWIVSDKESLIKWVSQFLWLWDDEEIAMFPTEAAEIIVSQLVQAHICLLDSERKGQIQLPNPQVFFHKQEDQQL